MRTWMLVIVALLGSDGARAQTKERLFVSISKSDTPEAAELLAAAGRAVEGRGLELVDAKGQTPTAVGLPPDRVPLPPPSTGSSKGMHALHRKAESACASRLPSDRKALSKSQQVYAMGVATDCARRAAEALFLDAARGVSAKRAVFARVEATRGGRQLVVSVVDTTTGHETRAARELGSDDTEAAVLERLLAELLGRPIATSGRPALSVSIPKAATPGTAHFGYVARQDAESLPLPEGCASLPAALEILPAKDPLGLTLSAQWAKTAALAKQRTPKVRCALASFEGEGGGLLDGAKTSEFHLTCKGAAAIAGIVPDVLLIKREKQPTEAVVGKKLIAGLLQSYCQKP